MAHSIAHHALSGLCYVHPHLGEYLWSVGQNQVAVDLLVESFDPPISQPSREIVSSVAALREKFAELLAAEGIERAEIVRAAIVFYYPRSHRWPLAGHIEVETARGVVVKDTIDNAGRPAELLGAPQ